MKQGLILFSLLLLGCASEQPIQYYLLPDSAAQVPSVTSQSLPLLTVRPVQLAPYLDRDGLIYRTSDTQVIETTQNLWAQDLSAQLTERIIKDLRVKQKVYWPMETYSALSTHASPQLQVVVQRFNGSYLGDAEIAGEWILTDRAGNMVKTQTFHYQISLEKEGFPSLVTALTKGVDQFTSSLATQL